MRAGRALVVAAILLPLAAAPLFGQPAAQPAEVLERFAVAKEGEWLVVPVKVGDKAHPFVLDTGATSTAYDKALLAGPPRATERVLTPRGEATFGLYDPPAASLGKLPLRRDAPVNGVDLKALAADAPAEVHGVLGMDFLKQHVVRIDFDRGEVCLLRAVPTDAGEKVWLSWHGDAPHLTLDVAGWGPERFLVDTGHLGGGAGCLDARLFQALVRAGKLRPCGVARSTDVEGRGAGRKAQGKSLGLGPFALADPEWHDSTMSAVGLDYLSRFVVTFDFPRSAAYFRKGARFAAPEVSDRTGLHCLVRGGAAVVEDVDKESPADKAGVVKGDVLVRFGKEPLAGKSMVQVQRVVWAGRGTVPVTVRRGGEEREVVLTLPQE